MVICLDCPSCQDRLSFRPPPGRWKGRLQSRCPGCSSTFALRAGQVFPVEVERGGADHFRARRFGSGAEESTNRA